MKGMKKRKFKAELEAGHKGAALIVPFDPEEVWGVAPRPVASKTYGKRPGHIVQGRLNGHSFEGWIGHRWRRFFILVDEDLQDAAGLTIGDIVDVSIELKPTGKET